MRSMRNAHIEEAKASLDQWVIQQVLAAVEKQDRRDEHKGANNKEQDSKNWHPKPTVPKLTTTQVISWCALNGTAARARERYVRG